MSEEFLNSGYSSYELLKMVVAFISQCGREYSAQNSGLVPRCLWEQKGSPLIVAYYAGFIDGAWETVAITGELLRFKEAWDPLSPFFSNPEAANIRQQTIQIIILVQKLYKEDELGSTAKTAFVQEFSKYIDTTVALTPEARYNQGKLIFEVASLFFGVGEVNAFLKTGKLTSNFAQGLAKMAKSGKKLIFALGKKIEVGKNKVITYIVAFNIRYNIARFNDEGLLIAEKWINEPVEVLERIGDIAYKRADNLPEKIAEIGIVKDKNGDVGLGLLGNAGGNLAKYSNIRKFLGNSRVKQYLSNAEVYDFEAIIKKAHPDVLKYIDEMDEFDFAEMVRGYRDLKKGEKLSTFENAIKSGDNFYGKYNGWLKYWQLTPGMKYSLTTIQDLKKTGKLLPTGTATDIQLASIQSFTRKGDFINRPLRYDNNSEFMGEYAVKGLQYMKDGFDALRKVPSRLVKGKQVFSGKAFSKADFENQFVNGIGKTIDHKSFISTSKLESVAEGFTKLTKQWAGDGDKIAVIQRIQTNNGVYIDDLSDWGKYLGNTRHPSADKAIQIQEEVVLNAGGLKQIKEPIPIMENGVHKTIDGMKAYYIDFMQL